MERKLSKAILLVWAGVSLGANLVAAPAKFQVATLSVASLVQVGRAQFAWVGDTEMVLALAAIAALLIARARPSRLLLAALGVFAAQKLCLQPMLQGQSDLLIAGQPKPDGSIHLLFVGAELLKFVLLLAAGLGHRRYACDATSAPFAWTAVRGQAR